MQLIQIYFWPADIETSILADEKQGLVLSPYNGHDTKVPGENVGLGDGGLPSSYAATR